MYAVFATGGKQYRAVTGDILKIEKRDAEKGATVELDQVLMVGEGEDVKVGSPYLKGGKVTATIVEHGRGEKIRILRFKRRKHHMKRMGHRQDFTRIEITELLLQHQRRRLPRPRLLNLKLRNLKLRNLKLKLKAKLNSRGIESWHIRKQVVVRATVAIPTPSILV